MIERPTASKKRTSLSDDTFGWIGLALVLIAAIIIDRSSSPHKWHAAIMWTFGALFGVLVFGRNKRSSLLFWFFWATCSVLHVVAMWVIFGQILPRLVLGTLYVVPLALIESLLLFVSFSKLERKVAQRR